VSLGSNGQAVECKTGVSEITRVTDILPVLVKKLEMSDKPSCFRLQLPDKSTYDCSPNHTKKVSLCIYATFFLHCYSLNISF